MKYGQTLDYLYARLPMFQRIGPAAYKADLNNTIALCTLLGHPENGFRSIHVAGTNGKGSTSHLLSSVLQSAGFKTGLFTSPHLRDFRERIRINGKKIPKSYVISFDSQNRKHFEAIQPSFFEYTTVMAFQFFKDAQVDVAIMETGMGGRLDSTNVITPIISVITNISNDHKMYLGNTLLKIAAEKAGIIKPGIPVVIGETQPETEPVFLERAKKLQSPIFFADQHFKIAWLNRENGTFQFLPGDDISFQCPLHGLYQEKNVITVREVLHILKDPVSGNHGLGAGITNESIREGFKEVIRQTGLQGRWQVLKRNPKVICDIGHNEAGIRYIVEQLKDEKFEVLHWVFGMVNDKDTDGILKLLPRQAIYYFCKANIPRGMEEGDLRKRAGDFGLEGRAYPSVMEAYMAATGAAGKTDMVFVGGSTFVVAEVL